MRKLELFIYIGLMLLAANIFLFPEVRNVHRHDFVQESRFQVYVDDSEPQMHFAGEMLPLRSKKVMRRFEREMEVKGQYNNSTVQLFRRANRWLPAMRQMIDKFDLPEDFQYIPIVESGLRNLISPAGAAGYWQLMPETAIEFGLEVNDEVDERFHPMKSTWAACRYLKRSHRLLGNWTNVAAGYNLGINGLRRVMDHQAVESYYHLSTNKETSRYVYKLVAVKELFEHPEKYGYRETDDYGLNREAVRNVEVTESIPDLDSLALAEGVTLRMLRQFNPWLIGESLTIKLKGDKYVLQIPKYPDRFLSVEDSVALADELSPTMEEGNEVDSIEFSEKNPIRKDSLKNSGLAKVHIADSLEKLSEIAESYGVTVDELMRWNSLSDKKVRKGQRLIISKPKAATEQNAAVQRERKGGDEGQGQKKLPASRPDRP